MEYKEVIEKLNNLDLGLYPNKEIKSLFKELGAVGAIVTTLHKGKRILRARINENSECFNDISELSFKPQKFNKTYQRASTPDNTMFYGSIVPEILGQKEPDTARITSLFELSDFVRDTETVGIQKVTYSVWEVKEDVHLISLIHYKKFDRPTELSVQLQQDYLNFIKKYPQYEVSSIETTSFFGEQFAKYVNSERDYDYMISAIYSEMITEFGYDGVLYPSVKLAGEGINIAVNPNCVYSKMQFIHAGECSVYKNKKNIFVGNDTYAIQKENNIIEYVKAPEDVFISKDFGLRQVELK